ncbi:MAG: hypothetical protein K5864_02085 [Bacteroidales bacterium]|nr:hypothetical protein [Bacteroidales bacterium]
MKTRYLKLSTAVLVTLMGVCGLSACKNDKTSLPWDSEDIDGMMVPEYGCPIRPKEYQALDSLRNVIQEKAQGDSVVSEKGQLESQELES